VKLTFIDAGVLIAAARGTDEIARLAMQVLDDPDRSFASSLFVKLETLPKATFNRQDAECAFYEAFFEGVSKWADIGESIVRAAFGEACNAGLSAMDSLHVAAAHQVGADELITEEKSTKRLLRSTLVAVVTIRPDRNGVH
jgi:predicted nucleic acid-binding protein